MNIKMDNFTFSNCIFIEDRTHPVIFIVVFQLFSISCFKIWPESTQYKVSVISSLIIKKKVLKSSSWDMKEKCVVNSSNFKLTADILIIGANKSIKPSFSPKIY